jgi:ABC-type polysaccharide/polyol phosphate transport system ATPase subunit
MAHPQAIAAHGLGKRYRLGEREAYGALRDTVSRAASAPARWVRGRSSVSDAAGPRSIWALRDVSFDVRQGEVVGIVGRNGSGKSTLLKILSRITDPTEGRATVRGRVGSLLEVGTGFHPELTGRENVFVNGAILGMRRRDIVQRFDAIVDFSGVSSFIDTPVKRYSSGMQMRLAFAVAAHLEPHILLVDEVLAVGDAEFQRRCLGKMHDVSREGRTVLLVSHQMGQIRRLCESVIWLDAGRVRTAGPAGETIHAYESAMAARDVASTGSAFLGWDLSDGSQVIRDGGRPLTLRVHLAPDVAVSRGHFGLGLLGPDDEVVAGWAFEPLSFPAGTKTLEIELPELPIRPGLYRWSFALFDGGNNLTGGRLVEKWTAAPELALDTKPLGHPQDIWSGILNLRGSLGVDGQPGRITSAEDAG